MPKMIYSLRICMQKVIFNKNYRRKLLIIDTFLLSKTDFLSGFGQQQREQAFLQKRDLDFAGADVSK